VGNAQDNGVGAYPGVDAARLLMAVNARQAKGRVGSIVIPSAVAGEAGLRPGTERYEEAVWRLLVGGALEVDGSAPPGVAARLPFGWATYRLGAAAVRLLGIA
jgi:hypothetical protein